MTVEGGKTNISWEKWDLEREKMGFQRRNFEISQGWRLFAEINIDGIERIQCFVIYTQIQRTTLARLSTMDLTEHSAEIFANDVFNWRLMNFVIMVTALLQRNA